MGTSLGKDVLGKVEWRRMAKHENRKAQGLAQERKPAENVRMGGKQCKRADDWCRMIRPKLMSFLSRSEIDRSTTCSRTAASFHSKEEDFLSDVSLGEIIASNNGAIAAYSEHNLSMSVLSFNFKASTASQITSK